MGGVFSKWRMEAMRGLLFLYKEFCNTEKSFIHLNSQLKRNTVFQSKMRQLSFSRDNLTILYLQ
ncbi:uncharacterized protein B0P05DRAFT_562823 [Gilbertella persicaria]|uniref:uncharacterized protein n=1 Tax=Gilbertella persicaria TaxID=101096 RepID=UPI002220DF35|nr:uncharacterized protein B0P05DRAFT_562823 [Gilbertella persicaria]KAI8051068.1 hypothetical protein B0P05DRAFT_562823 [Gilbertella persicaria]